MPLPLRRRRRLFLLLLLLLLLLPTCALTNTEGVDTLRAQAAARNHRQELLNAHLVPPTATPWQPAFVLALFVHHRPDELRMVLENYEQLPFIRESLLVVSEDAFDPAVDAILRQHLTFAPYVRLFFPYAPSLHPDTFPGKPDLCDASASTTIPASQGCLDGFRRRPSDSALKHHSLWLSVFLLEGHLRHLPPHYPGYVFFTEQDLLLDGSVTTLLASLPAQLALLGSADCHGCAGMVHFPKLRPMQRGSSTPQGLRLGRGTISCLPHGLVGGGGGP
jgi:hypothetical protein